MFAKPRASHGLGILEAGRGHSSYRAETTEVKMVGTWGLEPQTSTVSR
jgi:hypothetical protein